MRIQGAVTASRSERHLFSVTLKCKFTVEVLILDIYQQEQTHYFTCKYLHQLCHVAEVRSFNPNKSHHEISFPCQLLVRGRQICTANHVKKQEQTALSVSVTINRAQHRRNPCVNCFFSFFP